MPFCWANAKRAHWCPLGWWLQESCGMGDDLQEQGQIQGFTPFRSSIAELGRLQYYFMMAQNHHQNSASPLTICPARAHTIFMCSGKLPSREPKEYKKSQSWASMS